MDIKEEFEHKQTWKQVSAWALEYEALFGNIRSVTQSDLCAWFLVQAWLEAKREERKQARRQGDEEAFASEIQLALLEAMGVEMASDLTREEAQALIDGRLKEKGRAEDKDKGKGKNKSPGKDS